MALFNEIYTNIDETNVPLSQKTGTGRFVLQDGPTINGATFVGVTLNNPTINGTVAGGATYTSINLTTPTINNPIFAGNPTGNVTGTGAVVLATNPTISSLTLGTPLTVPNGGTGANTFTNHGVLLGRGAAAIGATTVGANGTVLKGQTGADPIYAQVDLTTDVTGILPPANGGTGVSAFTAGSILFSNGTAITQDNANLFWDDAANRLGIGTNAPQAQLHQRSDNPRYYLEESDQGVDGKVWDEGSTGGTYSISTLTDGYAAGVPALAIQRSDTEITQTNQRSNFYTKSISDGSLTEFETTVSGTSLSNSGSVLLIAIPVAQNTAIHAEVELHVYVNDTTDLTHFWAGWSKYYAEGVRSSDGGVNNLIIANNGITNISFFYTGAIRSADNGGGTFTSIGNPGVSYLGNTGQPGTTLNSTANAPPSNAAVWHQANVNNLEIVFNSNNISNITNNFNTRYVAKIKYRFVDKP